MNTKPSRRREMLVDECPTCQRILTVNRGFGPPHDASPRCESGGHNHCACDRCF